MCARERPNIDRCRTPAREDEETNGYRDTNARKCTREREREDNWFSQRRKKDKVGRESVDPRFPPRLRKRERKMGDKREERRRRRRRKRSKFS